MSGACRQREREGRGERRRGCHCGQAEPLPGLPGLPVTGHHFLLGGWPRGAPGSEPRERAGGAWPRRRSASVEGRQDWIRLLSAIARTPDPARAGWAAAKSASQAYPFDVPEAAGPGTSDGGRNHLPSSARHIPPLGLSLSRHISLAVTQTLPVRDICLLLLPRPATAIRRLAATAGRSATLSGCSARS